jgi:proteic killer suppression protein
MRAGCSPPSSPRCSASSPSFQDMEREEELRTVPSWKAHMLTGDRKGTWSLFVTKNWRMTFRIDRQEIEIINLDYEDYH